MGNGDKTARIWDAATGKVIGILNGHEGTLPTATFSPDGSRILTASQDGTARVWDAANGNEIAALKHGGTVNSAEFSPDGRYIVTLTVRPAMLLRSSRTGRRLMLARR
jgi:WD40 repeat protein